jgi:hypothetical protein
MSEAIQQQQYSHTVEIETDSKGLAKVRTRASANDETTARSQSVSMYLQTIRQLKESGVKVAE